jgi:hypothetical protein
MGLNGGRQKKFSHTLKKFRQFIFQSISNTGIMGVRKTIKLSEVMVDKEIMQQGLNDSIEGKLAAILEKSDIGHQDKCVEH